MWLDIINHFCLISLEFWFRLNTKFVAANLQISHTFTLDEVLKAFLITFVSFFVYRIAVVKAILARRRKIAYKPIQHWCVILCILLQVILGSCILLYIFNDYILISLFCCDSYGIFVNLILGINLAGFDLSLKFWNSVKLVLHFSELFHVFQLASLRIFNHLGLKFRVIRTFRVLILPFARHARLIRIDRYVCEIHQIMDLRLRLNLEWDRFWHYHSFELLRWKVLKLSICFILRRCHRTRLFQDWFFAIAFFTLSI